MLKLILILWFEWMEWMINGKMVFVERLRNVLFVN